MNCFSLSHRRRRSNNPMQLRGYYALALFLLFTPALFAQVGNNNPSGPSGIFNGQAGACGYDPYTGNASRSITDIAVSGAVGEYPLALVRTANSRTPSTSEVFAWAGGWNHNYNWIMEDSPARNASNLPPGQYTVDFPDGRVETFKSVTWDPGYFRVRLGVDGSAGVCERLQPMDPQSNNFTVYLILPDGGKVTFHATQYSSNGQFFYKYTATGIIDPHGLQTTLTWENYGNGRKRLQKVTEPAGRYIQFSYTATNSSQISQVQEFINNVGRRIVQYYYYYTVWLDHVVYYSNPNWTARYQYVAANIGDPDTMPLLLWTCDDPMYPGPMKRIAYTYRTADNYTGNHPAYGQISSENYYDGSTVGAAVSTLTVPSATSRVETRGDDKTRTFTYTTGGYLTSCTDFMTPSHSTSQSYDAYKYINRVTDRNGHRTDFINDIITGNLLQVQFPLTPGDTPGQGNTRPSISYTYTNNYYLNSIQGENGRITTITRNANNNRITRVDFPDGGYETFSYDAAHFYQISTHRMKTGGTETFAYDGQHRLQYYSDPYHDNTSNPSYSYSYDMLHRLSGIADGLNHAINFDYNDRGQVTVTTLPWINGVRYTITNLYNSDGTLRNRTDELGHTTSYEYDDYRRLKTVTPPIRGSGDSGTYRTHFYYGANPWDGVNDYKLTDSKVTYLVPPSTGTRKIKAVYDDNRRKNLVTLAPGTVDEANTSYVYDNTGNVTWIASPSGHWINTVYDERNRPSSVNDNGRVTSFTYDTAGRRKAISRPNGQVITYDAFDVMNRVTQYTATQTPDPDAVTVLSYYTTADGANAPVGLLKTMKDPRLVALNSTEVCKYEYDLMGRNTKTTYPRPQANGLQTYEQYTYDTVGRLGTFSNRASKVQTYSYDQLNRMIGFSWNDGGLTPSVTFAYDEASRLVQIDNVNATISRSYYDDNLLHRETQNLSAVGGVDNKHVTYTYDEDGYPASLTIPGYTFDYVYTNRDQVKRINDHPTGLSQAYYEYDATGNVTLRNVNTSPVTVSNYSYDPSDRIISVMHTLNGTTRTYSYGYYDNSNNRKYAKRGITPNSPESNKGDVFGYDLADQTIAARLNILNPDSASAGNQTILYDANGNRTTFSAYGATDSYTINNLNQYTKRNNKSASYDLTGTMIASPDSGVSQLTCAYDAQNRLTQASKNGTTVTFKYDGLDRQVSQTLDGVTTYNTWDGWDLVEEYTNNPLVIQARYLYGPTGLVKELQNNRYYCQDGSGSTALLTDSTAHLLEWYRYDLQGAPFFYAPNDTQRNPNQSDFGVRHLFTGQQWYQSVGLYDLRNRFYSPDIGRFLQTDPIGFHGGNNLYRYCGNNPVTRWDPFGLQGLAAPTLSEGWTATVDTVKVAGSNVPEPIDPGGTGAPSGGGGGGGGGEAGGRGGRTKLTGISFSYGKPSRKSNSNTQQPPGTMVPFDIYHPTTTAEFIIAGNIIEGGDTTDTSPAIDPIDLLSGGIAGLLRSSVRIRAAKELATGADEAVFWAGIGRGGAEKASEWAAQHGGSTLESILDSRGITLPVWNASNPATVAAWRQASIDFAAGARGNVRVLQGDVLRLDAIWRDEFRALQANPNVNSVIMTNPNTGVEVLLWSR